MCIRDRPYAGVRLEQGELGATLNARVGARPLTRSELLELQREWHGFQGEAPPPQGIGSKLASLLAVSYTHLRAHETVLDLVCRLTLEHTNTLVHICTQAPSHKSSHPHYPSTLRHYQLQEL